MVHSQPGMLLSLAAPADNSQGPLYMEQALEALHPSLAENGEGLCFEYGCHDGLVGLYCRFSDQLEGFITQHLYGAYPDLKIRRRREDIFDGRRGESAWSLNLRLHPDIYPIERYSQDEDRINHQIADKLSRILTLMVPRDDHQLRCVLRFSITPTSRYRRWRSRRIVRRLDSPFLRNHEDWASVYTHFVTSGRLFKTLLGHLLGFPTWGARSRRRAESLDTTPYGNHQREDPLSAAMNKLAKPLFDTRVQLTVYAEPQQAESAKKYLLEIAASVAAFQGSTRASFTKSPIRHSTKPRPPLPQQLFLMSTEEIATLFHPTTESVRTHKLETNPSCQLEPPVNLPTGGKPDEIEIARCCFPGRRENFGLSQADRRRHVWISGKTGSGKSNLVERMIWQDILAGRGVALTDPHGDLSDKVVSLIPKWRTNDFVWLDLSDFSHPVGIDLFKCKDPHLRALVAAEFVAAIYRMNDESWGPQLEDCLRNTILSCMELPHATMLTVSRMLGDSRFRDQSIRYIKNPILISYWENEFSRLRPTEQTQVIKSVQNKIRPFLVSELLRGVVAQPKAKLDFRRVMDEQKILIINLSKGKIGENNVKLIGSLINLKLQQAVLSRADLPEEDRKDFYWYVDEFGIFPTQTFSTALAEGRKYRLNMTLATQSPRDLTDPAAAAKVFENVGTFLTFRLGALGARQFAEEIGIKNPEHIVRLPKFEGYASLLHDGSTTKPFSFRSLKAPGRQPGTIKRDLLRKVSRRNYARPLSVVDSVIKDALAPV